MSATESAPQSLTYGAYRKKIATQWDRRLCEVGRGTPAGEYHRRFWQPIAYVTELGPVPLAVRALGEDLVAFRDKSGAFGVLLRNCCHRNTSLEFGLIEEHGIRCCYHGRLFDVDGAILEMPGEPGAVRLRKHLTQGSYPVREFGGILFAYMGPPERIPVFPVYDRFTVPGMSLVPGIRWPVPCNWLQIQENVLDPYHAASLHTIPQRRGTEHMAREAEIEPHITFAESAAGLIYLAGRHVGSNIWIRSAEAVGPNVRYIPSFLEDGSEPKYGSQPWMSFWSLPVDDANTVTFFVSHVAPGETVPFDVRRRLENFGQTDERPYAERQWIPGDFEAQGGQGPITVHANEHLGHIDRGVSLVRKYIRANIDAVERGDDPHGMYWNAADVPPTWTNNFVIPASDVPGGSTVEGLLAAIDGMPERYRAQAPLQHLTFAAAATAR